MKYFEKSQSLPDRIWELDFARGTAMVLVVVLHFLMFRERIAGAELELGTFTEFVMDWGGAFFVFLSGLCASLGHTHFKRGAAVFLCGMLLTVLSSLLYRGGIEDKGILIQWGVLHMIGFAMMIYPLFRRWPLKLLAFFAAAVAAAGYYMLIEGVYVHRSFLYPLGLRTIFFRALDYFPILPYLGVFLAGTVLGRLLYKEKKSLFPVKGRLCLPVRFLCLLGRLSLWVYMAHMIVFYIFFKFIV